MVSPVQAPVQFEIWLYAKPSFRMSVAECGFFRSEEEACRVGALVRMWLQLGIYGPELRAAIPKRKDRKALFMLPEVLLDCGVDPARVLVTARRDDTESGDHHDLPPGVPERCDAGHGARGPHFGDCDVRAQRW